MESILDVNNPDHKEKLRRLFRIKQTEGEMMLTRGYSLDTVYMMRSDKNFLPIDLRGLQTPGVKPDVLIPLREQFGFFMSRQEFSSVYFNSANSEDKILVLYLGNEPGKQVAKKDFEIVLQFIQTQQFRHMILITETGLNPEHQNFVTTRTSGYNIEVFLDEELALNRTKHALAPISVRHVPARQVPQWAQEEKIQPEKLPMIMNVDPIAKWYGANPLDGFQYEIMGTTTDTAGYYRITRQTPSVKK